MENRYVNDRVEMELKDFKIEIEKKFEVSKLKDFFFPKLPEPKPQPRKNRSQLPNNR